MLDITAWHQSVGSACVNDDLLSSDSHIGAVDFYPIEAECPPKVALEIMPCELALSRVFGDVVSTDGHVGSAVDCANLE
jgi:hypothetical protein